MEEQSKVDLEYWKSNSVTQSKLQELYTEINEIRNHLITLAVTPEVEDRQVRMLSIRYAVKIETYNKLTSI